MFHLRASALILLFDVCSVDAPPRAPDWVQPVAPFALDRYLEKWYEIARLDHSFERGLSDVSATYARNDDGSVKVVNRGFDSEREAWQEAVGRADLHRRCQHRLAEGVVLRPVIWRLSRHRAPSAGLPLVACRGAGS